MPYYDSITTRYKAAAVDTNNRSYTANDDNIAGIVAGDTDLSFAANTNNKEVIVGGDVIWSSTEDLVAFDRVFRFTTTSSKFYGASTNSGVHAYFVNCTFRIQALISQNAGGTRTPVIGHSPGDWNTTRAVDITTNELGTGQSGWHFYNCKFIFEVGGSDATGILNGDMYDCTMLQTVPNMMDFVFYPMGNSIIRNFYSDCSAIDTAGNGNYSGYAFQFSRELEEASGLSLQNQYLYPIGNGLDFEFPILSAEQNQLYTGSGSGTPANPPVLRFGEFSTLISSATLASPKVNIRENGQIFWRNARNLASGADQCRAIASQRIERTVFSDVNQTTRRPNVKYTYTTNVDYTTAGNARSISSANTTTERTYITDSTGTPQGTYNFKNGAISSEDESYFTIDMPISFFRPDTGADVTDDFQTLQFDLSTSVEVNSLFGTTDETKTYNADLWADDQAAADANNGFWIPLDVANVVDLDDPNMVNYQSIGSIVGAGGADESIDLDGVYAKFKYAWYEKDISQANVPYDNVSDGIFDISGLTVNDLAITSSSDDAPYSIDTNTISIQATGLVASSSDVVTGIKADTISVNKTGIEANLEGNTIQELRQYDDDASDFDSTDTDTFTAKGCELGGNINITTTDGSNNVAVFRDVTWKSGTVVRRTPGATADVKVYLTGTTPATGVTFTNISEVIGVLTITVNLATAVSALTDVDALFFSSTDGSTFTALTASSSINADLDTVTYVVQYDPSVSGNEVYFSVVADQNTMVSGKVTGDTTVSTEAISDDALDESFTPVAGSDDEIALGSSNTLTITPPTDEDGSFIVLFGYTTAGLTVTNNGGRALFRRIERDEEFRGAVAKQHIPANYFTYTTTGIQFLNQTEADRISIRRSAADTLWNVNVRVLIVDPPVDLAKQLSTTSPRTYIEFLLDTAGVSLTEVLDALDNQTDAIRGTGNRTITEAYTQAKGAKNAVFAS